jgi:hypothetical protein
MATSSRRELLQRAGAGALAVAAIGGGGIAWRLVRQSVLQPGAGDAYAAWNAGLGVVWSKRNPGEKLIKRGADCTRHHGFPSSFQRGSSS